TWAAAAVGAAGAADRLPAGPGDAVGLGGDADATEARREGAARVRAGRGAAVLGCADGVLLLRHDGRVVARGAGARVRAAGGGAAGVCVRHPAFGRRSPRGRWDRLESAFPAPARPLRLSRHRLHAGDATRERVGGSGGALPEDGLLAGTPLRLAGRARRSVRRLAR